MSSAADEKAGPPPAKGAERGAAPGGKVSGKERKEQQQKDPPGGFDDSAVPRAPPGYTVRITFHRAEKLPMADLSTLSSDPYLTAELTTALATRHKEDPTLSFRSRTIWKSLEPAWEEQWILHHVPAGGFKLKIRIYDEDSSDQDDRLGNVHVQVGRLDGGWKGIREQPFRIKKASGSWRAYFVRAAAVCVGRAHEMSGRMYVSVECLGRSPGDDGGRAYTYGKNYWCKHYSPLLGRIANRKESNDERGDDGDGDEAAREAPAAGPATAGAEPEELDQSERARVGSSRMAGESAHDHETKADLALGAVTGKGKGDSRKRSSRRSAQRYNFQANQFQLRGPVPPELYHRYVEFRPFVKSMFTAKGARGFLLSKALHHQHVAVYNFNRDTRYGQFDAPCREMSSKFLELAHFDQGARIFTYVLTLDGLLRFTETGKEFGIDLLSKHTMHSDRSVYIAFSGEFFIRRLKHPNREPPEREEQGHAEPAGGDEDRRRQRPAQEGPRDPANYELIIDNDSGTYRPNAKMLPSLKAFLADNFPGLKVVTLDCQADGELMNKLKDEQRSRKKREQGNMVFQQVSRSSSDSSDDESRLDALASDADRRFQDRQAHEGQHEHADGPSSGATQKHKLGEALAPYTASHEHLRAALGERQGQA